MGKVGACEAKMHLFKRLERAARGERITIEKHGAPEAILGPADLSKKKSAGEIIAELKQFRARHRLNGLSIREMIQEGRR
jgi:prevent-host-death family protein